MICRHFFTLPARRSRYDFFSANGGPLSTVCHPGELSSAPWEQRQTVERNRRNAPEPRKRDRKISTDLVGTFRAMERGASACLGRARGGIAQAGGRRQ